MQRTLFISVNRKALSMEMGTARARAVSASTEDWVAIYTANTVAAQGSAEILPPMLTAPMKMASSVAPIIRPVWISPSRIPATSPATMGRSHIFCAQK